MDCRNEIRIPNSGAKCLIENWVEERATRDQDPDLDNLPEGVTSRLQLIKGGHKGVVTKDGLPLDTQTIYGKEYVNRGKSGIPEVGARDAMKTKYYYSKFISEMDQYEGDPPPKPTGCSEFQGQYTKEFDNSWPKPTANHNIEREQPVTFWTEHKNNIHSVSSVRTGDTPFRKNTAFSKPIGEHFNQTKPYDFENYPKM